MSVLLRDFYTPTEIQRIRYKAREFDIELEVKEVEILTLDNRRHKYKCTLITENQFDKIIERLEEKAKKTDFYYSKQAVKLYKKLRKRLENERI